MAVIGVYIFLGALVFGVWEKWTSMEASYFCYITISTIGFGDLVPGAMHFADETDQLKMIAAAFYMLFGIELYDKAEGIILVVLLLSLLVAMVCGGATACCWCCGKWVLRRCTF